MPLKPALGQFQNLLNLFLNLGHLKSAVAAHEGATEACGARALENGVGAALARAQKLSASFRNVRWNRSDPNVVNELRKAKKP